MKTSHVSEKSTAKSPVEPRKNTGFTLLEVMMAVAILGLLLTSIFSSEAGAIKIAHRARKTEIAVPLVRCKMGEIEEQLAKEGFPALYASGSDQCCKEAEIEGFTCDWAVNRIVMPETMFQGEDEEGQLKSGKNAAASKTPKGLSQPSKAPLDLSQAQSLATAAPGMTGQTGALGAGQFDVTQIMQGGGTIQDGIAAMAIPIVYPVLKPFIEDQIRRATVTVKWNEGEKQHSFEVVQYLVIEQPPLIPTELESLVGSGGSPQGIQTNPTNPINSLLRPGKPN
jgi:general secretion pathway protein I